MSSTDYWIIDDEIVPMVVISNNIHTVETDDVYCSRCNKLFIREPNVKKGTAPYYRCKECLGVKTMIKDFIYSCNIM